MILSLAAPAAAADGSHRTSSAVTAQLIPRKTFDKMYAELLDSKPLAALRGCIESKMLDPFYEIEYLTGFYTRLCLPPEDEGVSAEAYIENRLTRYNEMGYNEIGLKDMENIPDEAIVFVYMSGAEDAKLVCGEKVRTILTDSDIEAVESAAEMGAEEIYEHIHNGAKELIVRLFDDTESVFPEYSYAAEYIMYPDRNPDSKPGAVAQQPFFPEFDGEQKTILSYIVRKIYKYAGIQLIVQPYDKSSEKTPEETAQELVDSQLDSAEALEYIGTGGRVMAVVYSSDGGGAIAGSEGTERILADEEKQAILKACSSGKRDEYESVYAGMAMFAKIVFNNGRYSVSQDQIFTDFLENAAKGPNYLKIIVIAVIGMSVLVAGIYVLYRVNREKISIFSGKVQEKIMTAEETVKIKARNALQKVSFKNLSLK